MARGYLRKRDASAFDAIARDADAPAFRIVTSRSFDGGGCTADAYREQARTTTSSSATRSESNGLNGVAVFTHRDDHSTSDSVSVL